MKRPTAIIETLPDRAYMVNPTARQVEDQAARLERMANRSRKRRLCTFDPYFLNCASDRRRAKQGSWESNGGGVANSYGYGTESTRVAVAWWTDANGRRHVTLRADAVRVSGRHVTSLLGRSPIAMLTACPPLARAIAAIAAAGLSVDGSDPAAVLIACDHIEHREGMKTHVRTIRETLTAASRSEAA